MDGTREITTEITQMQQEPLHSECAPGMSSSKASFTLKIVERKADL